MLNVQKNVLVSSKCTSTRVRIGAAFNETYSMVQY